MKKKNIFVLLLMLFFAPFNVGVGLSSISINYTGVLLYGISKRLLKISEIAPEVIFFFIFCFFSYLWGIFFVSKGDADFLLRQFLSFFSFIAMLGLLFVVLPYSVDEICNIAVICSLIYSLWALIMFGFHPELSFMDPHYVKEHLRDYVPDWSQRYSVLVTFSLVYAGGRIASYKWGIAFLILFGCVILTFTRAVYVAAGAGIISGMVAFVLAKLKQKRTGGEKIVSHRKRWLPFAIVFLILIIITTSYPIMLSSVGFIGEYTATTLGEFISGDITSKGSLSDRIEIYDDIINIVRETPIFGTGFAGFHQFDVDQQLSGSAHGQYMDVLLRTGIVGLIFYLFMWLKVLRSYCLREPSIFGGFVAILVFGLFHETTKLPYGALLFFLLLNKAYEINRSGLKSGHIGTV